MKNIHFATERREERERKKRRMRRGRERRRARKRGRKGREEGRKKEYRTQKGLKFDFSCLKNLFFILFYNMDIIKLLSR